MRLPPSVEIGGQIQIGGTHVRWFLNGFTIARWGDGQGVWYIPEHNNVEQALMASALGYGRIHSGLIRDQLITHCIIADMEGRDGPDWLAFTVPGIKEKADRANMLLRYLRCGGNPEPKDVVILRTMKETLDGQLEVANG